MPVCRIVPPLRVIPDISPFRFFLSVIHKTFARSLPENRVIHEVIHIIHSFRHRVIDNFPAKHLLFFYLLFSRNMIDLLY